MNVLGFNIGFLEVKLVDILDILLVTILLYNLYKLLRGSGALRIFIGFLALYLVYLVVKATEMKLLTEILGQFMGVGVLAAIILFQQEIRKFLLLIGKSTDFNNFQFFNYFKIKNTQFAEEINILPIIDAMKAMSATHTGALIVVSRDESLSGYAETGDRLDADISKRLIQSIFFKNSPLHDGAMIIWHGRIVAARCILPVSDNAEIPANMGLRHRSAIGMSEATNAAVLIVSEETGTLSFAIGGRIYHNLSPVELRKRLHDYLVGESGTHANESNQDKLPKNQALSQMI